MSYWVRVLRRAAKEAAKDAKIDTWANAVIAVLAQTLISAAIWIALGRAMPDVTLLTRFFATAAPFLIFPVAFFVRLIVVPSDMAKEDAAQIETLENCLTSSERRKAVKDILGRYLEEGNEILRDPNTKQGLAMKESAERWATKTRSFIAAAFGSGAAMLFLSDAGYTFFSPFYSPRV